MAKIIPEIYDKENQPPSEEFVLNLLATNLDDEWTVIHSFKYVYLTARRARAIGEIDFILCHPRYGFLVMEVKGGAISYFNGVWYSNGNAIDPISQVVKNWGNLLHILTPTPLSKLTLPLAHAVCFPDCEKLRELPPEADGVTITKNDFSKIENVVVRILESRESPSKFARGNFDEINFDEALKILVPKLEAFGALDIQLEEDKKKLDSLSDEQFNAFCMLKNFDRFNVRGCAGSGKTMLAINLARNIARQGRKVLFLCYNKLLAKEIAKTLSNDYNVTVRAFYEYCKEVARITKDEINKYKNHPKLYSVALPKKMKEAVEKFEICYDCIIVDEGQDFNEIAWETIESMLVVDGKFYVFYDEDQNIFSNEYRVPQTTYPEVELTRNFRNSARVFEYIKKYIKKENVSLAPNAPVGQNVEEYSVSNKDESFAVLDKVVGNLRDRGVAASSITILGAHSLKNTCVGERKSVGGFQISDSESITGEFIRYRTYMKFKGCESKVVIAIDVDPRDERWERDSYLYTAYSRAKSLLVVIKIKS